MSIFEATRRHAMAFAAGALASVATRPAGAAAATTPAPGEIDDSSTARNPALGLTRTPFDYGASGDATRDDGPALRRAIASHGKPGGAIDLPAAQYKAGASGGQILFIDAPLALSGKGASLSIINPELASDADDTIVVSPNRDFSHEGLVLGGFGLLNPVNGQRRGRRGLVLDTTSAGQRLAGVWLDNLSIGAGTGANAWGIHHRNAPGENENGGWYGGGIRRSLIKGGILLEHSGDSLHVADNILSGKGRSLTVNLIKGASCLIVSGNNMTSDGGAIMHISGQRCVYINNNIEHRSSGIVTDNDGHRSVAEFSSVGLPGIANRCIGGLISCFADSDANVLVKIKNQRGFVLDSVTLLSESKDVIAVYVDSSSTDTVIGQLIGQDRNGDGSVKLQIVDHGVGTIGVTKKVLSTGSGHLEAGNRNLWIRKFRDGTVRVWGSVSLQEVNSKSVIANVPVGFRPENDLVSCYTAHDMAKDRQSLRYLEISQDGDIFVSGPIKSEYEIAAIDISFLSPNPSRVLTFE